MIKILTLFLLTFSIFICGQEEKTDATYFKDTVTKVTSLKFSFSSIKDLESIVWEDVKSIFDKNSPEEKVALSFEIDLKEVKNKFKGSTTVSGPTKNLDSLIIRAKKTIKSLIRISKGYKNK
jgi:hypothetical protein